MLWVLKFVEELEYSFKKAFEQCESNGKIYFGTAVCVKREIRVKGLGSKLVQKSIEYAKELGCSHMYVMATGIYSQKIFQNHNFNLINKKEYANYKDNSGNVIINDEIHNSVQILALRLN